MNNKILKRKDYLNLLARSKKNIKKRNALIDLADKDEINALCEIILNALDGNLKLNKKQINILKKYKNPLRRLLKKKYSIKKKKNILKQSGGFLGALIPIAISALTSLFKR